MINIIGFGRTSLLLLIVANMVLGCNTNHPENTTPIQARALNALCLAGNSSTPYQLEQIFTGIDLNKPVAMAQVPGDLNERYYIAEKDGRIISLPARNDVDEEDVIVALNLNVITDIESGIASIAFHPNYALNGRFYVTYAAPSDSGTLEWRLSVFERAEDGVSFGNEHVLIQVIKENHMHLGGSIAFGPEGYLYVSIGDDGSNLDGDENKYSAQDPNSFLGSILRIDVDNTQADLPYAIPQDNPIFNGNLPTEVWAIGFRNPWRISFDSHYPHTLWSGDVGWSKTEEINIINGGENYGWPHCEGPCQPSNYALKNPTYSYPSTNGAAVVGGFVYRGSAIPELYGKYVFADYMDQVVRTLDTTLNSTDADYAETIINAGSGISSFARDNVGELYPLDFRGGKVYRLTQNPTPKPFDPPGLLSSTGCFSLLRDGNPKPLAGVHEYDIAQQFWSDGAVKKRLLAIPDNTTIDATDPDNWILPPGGVVIKHFYLNDSIIETRFFVRYENGTYAGYTYAWKEDKSDAVLVEENGMSRTIGNQEWYYPSRSDCMQCHNKQSRSILSLETRQLNINHYDSKQGQYVPQMQSFRSGGLIDVGPAPWDTPFPTIEELQDPDRSLEQRVSAYLHVNCSSCHRGDGSAGRSNWDARYGIPIAEKDICGTSPFITVNEQNNAGEKLVLPGNHDLSTLWLRTASRDTYYSMPPLASNIPDNIGIDLIQKWISAIDAGCASPDASASNTFP